MNERELTTNENRFIQELQLDRDAFRGALDSYSVVERGSLALDQPVVAQIHGLELLRNSRFGNQVLILTNMLIIARILKMPWVFLPENPLFRRNFVVGGVHFTQCPPANHHNTLRGQFFRRDTFRRIFDGHPKPIKFSHSFRGALVPLSGNGIFDAVRVSLKLWLRSIANQVRGYLTIHIRSGDIFVAENPHPGYWQPPLSYYKEVIEQQRPGAVSLIFEDTENPVIPELVEWLLTKRIRCRLVDGPIEAAICELVSARHVVAGRGTFVPAVLSMSKSCRKLTTFSQGPIWQLFPARSTRTFWRRRIEFTVVPPEDFEKLVNPWTNTSEQRENMLSYQLSRNQKAVLEVN